MVSLAICFHFPPLPTRSFFYWLSRDLFTSALYHLPFSRLILSHCLPLQVSREPGRLFQCMRLDNHSAVIFCQLFSSLLSSHVCIDIWRNASSLKLDIVLQSLLYQKIKQQKRFFRNYSIDYVFQGDFLWLDSFYFTVHAMVHRGAHFENAV